MTNPPADTPVAPTEPTWADILAGHYRDWPHRDRHPLVYLRLQGLAVTAKPDGGLSLRPATLAAPELVAVARAHKPAILAALEAEARQTATEAFCAVCHRWRCACP